YSEIKENYSAIKDEILYPPPSITITVDGSQPPGTATLRSGESEINLTGLSVSDTLDNGNQQPDTEETEVPLKPIMNRESVNALLKQAGDAAAELDRLEGKYSADLPNDSVITFKLKFPGTPIHFNYAAVKAAGQWFATGRLSKNHPPGEGIDWSDM